MTVMTLKRVCKAAAFAAKTAALGLALVGVLVAPAGLCQLAAGAAMLLAAAVVYGIGARCEDAGRAVAAKRLPASRAAAQQPRTGR